MKEKTVVKEKNFDLKGFLKNLVSSEPIELTQEEIILSDSKLTDEEKKMLIKSLGKSEKLGHMLFANNLKAVKHMNLTTNAKDVNIKIDEKVLPKSKNRQKERGE